MHKVKTETLMDENLEKLRDTFSNVRDLAILELLIYTDMKIGELTRLNISDMDYINKVHMHALGEQCL